MQELPFTKFVASFGVTLDDVRAAQVRDRHVKHHPINHIEVYNKIRQAAESSHIRFLSEQHMMKPTGASWMCFVEIEALIPSPEHSLIMIIRNGHDRNHAAGILVGVCVHGSDGIVIEGEIKIGHHPCTGILRRELDSRIIEKVPGVHALRTAVNNRIDRYKRTPITTAKAHDLIMQMYRYQVIGQRTILPTVTLWAHPKVPAKENLFRLFNAVSPQFATNPFTLAPRSTKLHAIVTGDTDHLKFKRW